MKLHLVHDATCEQLKPLCPKCKDVTCDLRLRESGEMQWCCLTLDCGFTAKYKRSDYNGFVTSSPTPEQVPSHTS
jgi:hypothetical protein